MVSVQLPSVGGVCVASRAGDAPPSQGGAEPGRSGRISTLPPDWQRIGCVVGQSSAGETRWVKGGRVLTWATDRSVLTFLRWNAWLAWRFMSHTFSASSESCTLHTFLLFFFSFSKIKKIWAQRDLVTQGAFSFSFSLLLHRANVSHAGKQMCACANLRDCVGGGPPAHVRVRVRLRCAGAEGARSSRVAARQISFLQIRVWPKGKD